MDKTWFKDNGFKDISIIPEEIKTKWYEWNKEILLESERLKIEKKHKYVLVLGKNKTENKFLSLLKNYEEMAYPKKLII